MIADRALKRCDDLTTIYILYIPVVDTLRSDVMNRGACTNKTQKFDELKIKFLLFI